VKEWLANGQALAAWCERAGIELHPDEAAVFLAAALVLLPPEQDLAASLRDAAPPSEALVSALRALRLRTGMAPRAPTPMPLHPLSPGLIAIHWRRLRTALSQALGVQAE
jgi:hypothetical protein